MGGGGEIVSYCVEIFADTSMYSIIVVFRAVLRGKMRGKMERNEGRHKSFVSLLQTVLSIVSY